MRAQEFKNKPNWEMVYEDEDFDEPFSRPVQPRKAKKYSGNVKRKNFSEQKVVIFGAVRDGKEEFEDLLNLVLRDERKIRRVQKRVLGALARGDRLRDASFYRELYFLESVGIDLNKVASNDKLPERLKPRAGLLNLIKVSCQF